MHRHSFQTIFILAFCGILMRAAGLCAQERGVMLGPSGGFGIGAQFGSVPVYAGSEECGVFRSGSARGAWGGVRLLFPSLFSERIGLSAMGSWASFTGSFSAAPIDNQLARDPQSGALITLDRIYVLRTASSIVQLDLLADYHLSAGWHIAAGPWIGYRLSLSTGQVDSINGPGRAAFAGGERSLAMSGGIALTPRALGYGALVAVGVELPVGARIALLPEVSVRATFASPAREVSIGGLTVGAGLSLLFDLRPSPVRSDTIVPPETMRRPHLSASIRIDGVDEHGTQRHMAAVELSTVAYRTFTPLLPAVFFEQNASAIPARYGAETPGAPFALDSLFGRDALTLHRHTLDIIGSRLESDPAATITLYGAASSDESATIAAARAQQVKAYLVRRWRIAEARITIGGGSGPMRRSGEGSEEGRAENRRVEIVASSPSVLAPVVSTQMVRSFNPPSLTMIPTMEAEAGVKRWSIDITQGGAPVAHYSSEGNGASGEDIMWRIGNADSDSLPSPIGADLMVEDATGAVITAHDEMPIEVQRHDRVVDRTVNSLVGFEYDSPEPGASDRSLLKDIAAAVDAGSRVTITGYTDRIGSEEYNADLSRRRAERVAAILQEFLASRGVAGVEVDSEAGGIEKERFTNDLPEGRMLSRGVRLIVTAASH
jgi:outer membrane protein OmpA-like peptidoglycan-associated protein